MINIPTTAQNVNDFPNPNNTVISKVRNTGNARAMGYAREISEYLYAHFSPVLQIAPLNAPQQAKIIASFGNFSNSPELNANGSMVKKSELENRAKNAIEGRPLLLQRKCHKLCIKIEDNINTKAVILIKKTLSWKKLLRLFSTGKPSDNIPLFCRKFNCFSI